ncbi:MAG: ABC transporter ATP-binding protein [Bacillota bacterium]
MRQFLTLKDFFLKHKWRYLVGIIWLVLTDLLQLVTPRLLGNFADEFQLGTLRTQSLLRYAGLIVLLAVGIAFFRYLWRVYVNGTARYLEYDLRNRLFQHLERLSPSFFDQHKTGDLMAHATNDINAIRMALGPGIVMFVDAVVLSATTITIMYHSSDHRLMALALLPLPLMALTVTSFGRVVYNRFRQVQETFASLTGRVQENISGIRVVQAFVQEEAETAKFTQVNSDYVHKNLSLVRIQGAFFPLVQLLSSLSFLVVLGYGGTLVLKGSISLGDFVSFYGYLALLTWPMMALGWVINMLQRGSASMARINDIMNTKPEIVEMLPAAPINSLKGNITIRDLTFSYASARGAVLKNINLHLPAGQTLAIIGRTGSGKTTLVLLLLRLYDPPPGTVFIDGEDVRHIPLATLRGQIGYVPQDDFLFSTTIAGNITFAGENFSRQEVATAACMAQVDGDVATFPHGYDTMVGERGITLSGGQKQRVAMARALIKSPQVLILDDSFSAVDTRTEEDILRNLQEIRRGRTNIIISHRISTIRQADHIIVLDDGGIAEEGNHASLLAREGLYHRLHQQQQLEAEMEAEGGEA